MDNKLLRVLIGEAANSQRSYLLVLHGNVTCLTRQSYGSAIRFLPDPKGSRQIRQIVEALTRRSPSEN